MRHVPDARPGRRRPYGYYGVPPIRKPHWKLLIIWYFFLGGLSAGSYVVATVAELFGDREDRDTVRVGRYLALFAILPCPILLTLDLGRPERFYNMLRVFKLRSPMSIGTWGLLSYSGFAMLSGLAQAARDGLLGRAPSPLTGGASAGRGRLFGFAVGMLGGAPTRLIGLVGATFGFFVGGYTGVLLGATAVPIWAKNVRLLGPLFLTSAVAAACAAISLVLALLPGHRRRALDRLQRAETVAAVGELAVAAAIHLNSGRLGAPLETGRLGRLYNWGSIGLGFALPMGLHLVGPRLGLPQRMIVIVASLASLTAGFIVKYAWVIAGRVSADDPAATFEFAEGRLPDEMTPPSDSDSESRGRRA